MILNRERAEEKMSEHGIKALVATSEANIYYSTDVYPYGDCAALLPLDRGIEPGLVAPARADKCQSQDDICTKTTGI